MASNVCFYFQVHQPYRLADLRINDIGRMHEQYFDEPSMHSGTTLKPYQRHRIPLERVDDSKEVLFTLAPGDGVFFTNFTWHRAEPNHSGEHKFAYAIAYQLAEGNAKYEVDPRPQLRK